MGRSIVLTQVPDFYGQIPQVADADNEISFLAPGDILRKSSPLQKGLAASRTFGGSRPPYLCCRCRSGLSPGCPVLRRSRCKSICFALTPGSPEARLLSRS